MTILLHSKIRGKDGRQMDIEPGGVSGAGKYQMEDEVCTAAIRVPSEFPAMQLGWSSRMRGRCFRQTSM